MPMMTLGTFVFTLRTLPYQLQQRQNEWRHPASERVGARAAHQYVGPGEETIELSGVVAPELTGSEASLATLVELANEGRPLALVSGTGQVLGAFVITSKRETRTLFFQDGTPRRIDFQLTLLRTDETQQAGASA